MDIEDYLFFKGVVDQMCTALGVGDTLKKITNVKGLCWIWTNVRTKEEWIIGVSSVVSIRLHDDGDPRVPIVVKFVHSIITPQEAKTQLEQLEKLRAFW